jgi:hypothetical protein
LKWRIVDDREGSMALEYPARDEVPKFSLVVRGSLCIAGDTLRWIDDLALTGFDVADKVCCRIFFAFTSKDYRRVSSTL